MQKSPQVNTPSKRERHPTTSRLDYDDDGYLHFQRQEQYDSLRVSTEEKEHEYSYINPEKLDTPVAKARPSTVHLEQNSGPTNKTPTCSRKCYLVAVLVVICAVTATAIGVYYIMENKQEKCTCQSDVVEGENGTHSSITTTMVSGITSPTSTSEVPTTTQSSRITTTSIRTTTIDIATQCLNKSLIIPHLHECQGYYNCSKVFPTIQDIWYYEECTYPELFNIDTLSCDHFENVECGARKEPKSGCEYKYLQCIRYCIPCEPNYPSCVGMNDGRNVYKTQEWSPFYAVCYKERFIASGRCEKGDVLPLFFSPVANACVSLDRIPRQYGGLMPNCTGKVYGTYPNEYGICDRYTICGGGEFLDFVECPDDQAYDETSKKCSPFPNTCVCEGGTDWYV